MSRDGGDTWRSLGTQATTSTHDPYALPEVIAALPGFTGTSNGWTRQRATIQLEQPANALLAFTYRTDESVIGGGCWIDNIAVNATTIGDGTSLAGWSDLAPPVGGVAATLISYTDHRDVIGIAPIPLPDPMTVHLDAGDLRAMVAPGAQTVAVIITHTQSDMTLNSYERYRLSVNGILQPGGTSSRQLGTRRRPTPPRGRPYELPYASWPGRKCSSNSTTT